MITIFEKYTTKPDVNSVSPEFWNMVSLANWNLVLKTRNNEIYELTQAKVYKKYSYTEIKKFEDEIWKFYLQLYDYFFNIWTDKRYEDLMPSDDGYEDLLCSMIGKGKKFVEDCINDKQIFVNMANNNVENFSYLLRIDEDEYNRVRSKYDPFWREVNKYNL